jgi:hypothetical protein
LKAVKSYCKYLKPNFIKFAVNAWSGDQLPITPTSS